MPEPKYAGFWIRLVADIIDSVILTLGAWILEILLLRVIYWVWVLISARQGRVVPAYDDAFNPFFEQMFNMGIYFCISFPYFVWGHFKYGTTLGKLPLKIYVVDHRTRSQMTLGQSIGRFFAYLLSYLPFCAGFIMAAFHPEKRALHELISGTVSIRKKSFSNENDS